MLGLKFVQNKSPEQISAMGWSVLENWWNAQLPTDIPDAQCPNCGMLQGSVVSNFVRCKCHETAKSKNKVKIK